MPNHKNFYNTGIGFVIVAIICALFYFSAIYNPALKTSGELVGVIFIFLAFFIAGICFMFKAYSNARFYS